MYLRAISIESGVPKEAIIHEKKSKNTRDQAVEVIKLAISNNWRKIILVATHDHQYRAYLTFLKEVLDSKSDILLFNSPVRNLKWFEENAWGRRFDNIDKEFKLQMFPDRLWTELRLRFLCTVSV